MLQLLKFKNKGDIMTKYVGNSNIPAFLMASPFTMGDPKNVINNNIWMDEMKKEGTQIFDIDKMMRQHHEIQKILSSVGVVHQMTTDKPLQDLVYTANAGMVFPHLDPNEDRRALVSNFKSLPRKGETEIIANYYKSIGFEPVIMPDKNAKGEDMYFEGEADLKWVTDNIYIGACSDRTNLAALEWIEENFDCKIIPFKLKESDPYLYHLDCSVLPLLKDVVLMDTSNVEKSVIKQVEKYAEVIPLDDDLDFSYDLALSGMTNSVRAGQVWIMPSNIQELSKTKDKDLYEVEKAKIEIAEDLADELCLQLVVANISSYYCGGASLSCLVQHLNKQAFMGIQ